MSCSDDRVALSLAGLLFSALYAHPPGSTSRHLLARHALHAHPLRPRQTAPRMLGSDRHHDLLLAQRADVGDQQSLGRPPRSAQPLGQIGRAAVELGQSGPQVRPPSGHTVLRDSLGGDFEDGRLGLSMIVSLVGDFLSTFLAVGYTHAFNHGFAPLIRSILWQNFGV